MQGIAGRRTLGMGLGCVLLAGCQFGAGRLSYPEDPLLRSKPPVAGVLRTEKAAQLAWSEPVPPTQAPTGVAGTPRNHTAARVPTP